MKKAVSLFLAFAAAHGIPILSRLISERIDYSFIQADPMRQLAYMLVTYMLQVLLAIAAIRLLLAKRLTDAGFNLQNRAESGRLFLRFMLGWTCILLIFYTLALIFVPSFLDYIHSFYNPGILNAVKNIAVAPILAGLGEEPLYRGLVVPVLAAHWQGHLRIGRVNISHAALLCGFLFMTAHVGYVFTPRFAIVHLDALQLTYTFLLGVVWAYMFERTKSLLAPAASHIFANAIQYALAYAVVFLMR